MALPSCIGGGANVSHEFAGGGGGTYCRACSPKPLLEASELGVGLVGASFLLREMTGSRQKGGGKRIVGGGSKNVFGEGFYGMFPPLPPEFSTPLRCSLIVTDRAIRDFLIARSRFVISIARSGALRSTPMKPQPSSSLDIKNL